MAVDTADDAEVTRESASRPTLKRAAIGAGRAVFALAVLSAIAYTVSRQWSGVVAYLDDLSWVSVGLSLMLVLAGMTAATIAFRAALRSVGHRVGLRTASQIYLIGLLAKYLPGSVWAFILQAELGKRANLPRSRPFVASLVLTGISATVALTLGLFAIPTLLSAVPAGGEQARAAGLSTSLAIALLILFPIAVVLAIPPILSRVIGLALRLLRRPPLDRSFTWTDVATLAGWSVITLAFFGTHLWMLAKGEGGPGIATCAAAMALGLTAGMLAFLVPSGLGARDAVIVAALLPFTSFGAAVGMALVSRMVFTAADLIAAGAAALSGLRVFAKTPHPTPSDDHSAPTPATTWSATQQ